MIVAAITAGVLLEAVVWIVVAGLIYYLLTWLIHKLAIPEPFGKVAEAIVAILAVVFLINALLTIVGKPFITF